MKDPTKTNVLVACEESQRVCMAFRERGFNAFSCDIQECSGGHPEYHILGDAVKALDAGEITTMDGRTHHIICFRTERAIRKTTQRKQPVCGRRISPCLCRNAPMLRI